MVKLCCMLLPRVQPRYVTKCILYLQSLSLTYKFQKMRRKYFAVIDDQSADFHYYKQKNMFTFEKVSVLDKLLMAIQSKQLTRFSRVFLNRFVRCIFQNLSIIKPSSFVQVSWELVILILLLINLFYIPIKIAFASTEQFNIPGLYEVILEEIPQW